VLLFDNGYFSEFGTFSITDGLGHTPPEVLAKTFDLPAETFADFPKKQVYIATGLRPALPQKPAPGLLDNPPLIHRYQLLAQKGRCVCRRHHAQGIRLEFPISTTMTGALLIIEPGALRELHRHPNAAEWQFYLKGSGHMMVFGSHGRARTDEFAAGDVGLCLRATALMPE
jgi:oxalate decarboxylase